MYRPLTDIIIVSYIYNKNETKTHETEIIFC